MDQRKIIKEKLYPIFCEMNKQKRKYAEIWLSFLQFGKVYTAYNRYELVVKLLPGVERNSREIEEISDVLDRKANQEFKPILIINILDENEFKRCKKKDVMIYCDGQ